MKKEVIKFTDKEKFLLEQLAKVRGKTDISLKNACSDDWSLLDSPTKFGRKIKALVEAGLLGGVRLAGKATNNHQHYSFG